MIKALTFLFFWGLTQLAAKDLGFDSTKSWYWGILFTLFALEILEIL